MMYTITDFDPLKNDEKAWLDSFKRKNTQCKFIYEDGNLLLCVQCFSKASTDGREIVGISIDGAIGTVSDELELTIAGAIAQLMQHKTAKSFLITTKSNAIQDTMRRLGGTVINQILYFHLPKKKFQGPLLNKWLENKDIIAGEIVVTLYEYVPRELYEPFAALMTELMNDIIRTDSRERFSETAEGVEQKMTFFRGAGIRMLLFLLSDRQGRLVGLSFTLVYPNSTTASQELTGVRKEYRGRKLAYFLKASTMKETFQRYPDKEYIETNCYSANEPILRINQAMGFQLKELALQYRVDAPAV